MGVSESNVGCYWHCLLPATSLVYIPFSRNNASGPGLPEAFRIHSVLDST